MALMDVIRKRKSVRQFEDKPVEQEKIETLLEAAQLAPSASNRQEWRFVVVQDKEKREALAEAALGQKFVGQAPVVLVCCAESDGHMMACGEPCYPIDVAIAMEHIALTAAEMGLGTCWIGAFKPAEVKKVCNIPEDIKVVELMPVGYPADPSETSKKRLPLEEIIHYDEWGRKKPPPA